MTRNVVSLASFTKPLKYWPRTSRRDGASWGREMKLTALALSGVCWAVVYVLAWRLGQLKMATVLLVSAVVILSAGYFTGIHP
jgi:hypothetical protein